MSPKRFEHEFTVQVVSSPSMELFGSKANTSLRNFFNDQIQLSGDWRVALSEIIFSTNYENIVDGEITVYKLKDYEDSENNFLRWQIVSRLYSGQKQHLCLVHLIQRNNFL